MPREPATIISTPEARLCVSASRRGRTAATSSRLGEEQVGLQQIVGEPDVDDTQLPGPLAAGEQERAGLRRAERDRELGGDGVAATAPDVPSTPEGMSTATTGTPEAFSSPIAVAHSSSGMPRKPVPKIASIATSARASSAAGRRG